MATCVYTQRGSATTKECSALVVYNSEFQKQLIFSSNLQMRRNRSVVELDWLFVGIFIQSCFTEFWAESWSTKHSFLVRDAVKYLVNIVRI